MSDFPSENSSVTNLPETIADAETLSYLLRTLVHDLINQISVMRLNCDLVKANPDRYNSEELRKKFERTLIQIENAINQTRKLNRKLLNPREFKPAKFCFISATCHVLKRYAIRAKRKGIILKTEIPEETSLVFADELAIRQGIISALLDNAIKFSGKGDQVLVKIKLQDSMISLIVYDNGIGIPDIWKDEILDSCDRERFRRKGTEGETGIGFGLLAASILTKYFGGQLGVQINDESEEYLSVFCISLPLVDKSTN